MTGIHMLGGSKHGIQGNFTVIAQCVYVTIKKILKETKDKPLRSRE